MYVAVPDRAALLGLGTIEQTVANACASGCLKQYGLTQGAFAVEDFGAMIVQSIFGHKEDARAAALAVMAGMPGIGFDVAMCGVQCVMNQPACFVPTACTKVRDKLAQTDWVDRYCDYTPTEQHNIDSECNRLYWQTFGTAPPATSTTSTTPGTGTGTRECPWGQFDARVTAIQTAINTYLPKYGMQKIGADGKLGAATCGAAAFLGQRGVTSLPTSCDLSSCTAWKAPTPIGGGRPPPIDPTKTTTGQGETGMSAATILLGLGAVGLAGYAAYTLLGKKKRRSSRRAA
jgi:hypothetical protein